jgi:voltage-gated potassium channel
MFVLGRVMRTLREHVRRVSWGVVFAAFVLHMGATWLLLAAAGEATLLGPDAFPYWYMTTATTIGYGDLSPSTTAGRYAVGFFVMPGAVALFASVLAKSSASLLDFWKRHQVGRMAYTDLRGHAVLVGWRGRESARLVQLLLSDTHTDDEGIVLVAEGIAENPLPDRMRFVAVESYADFDGYRRAAVAHAARVIVHCGSDDQTLAAVFAVTAQLGDAPSVHVVAHFDGDTAARLVRRHCPQVECTRPLHVDVIARAAQDAGSSLVATQWLCAGGATQFSLPVPDALPALSAARLAEAFRAQSALWIGYREPGADEPVLNPREDTLVRPGSLLYYLADARIDAARLAWPTLAAEGA